MKKTLLLLAALLLVASCGSKNKKFVWFEHGAHSHLRIVNPEKYDSEVTAFINS